MENITYFREAVEKLASDEKIDDGQYLEMMNRLKVMFEREEKVGERPPVVNNPNRVVFTREDDMGRALGGLFQNTGRRYFYEGEETRTGIVILHREITSARNSEVNTFRHHTLNQIPADLIRYISVRGVGIWVDLDLREIFLSNPNVRKQNINRVVEQKANIVGGWNLYKGEETTEEDWTRMLRKCRKAGLVFHTSKKVDRKETIVDIPINTLQKLHPITVSLHIPKHPNTEIHLYTDKIQLGRSIITPFLCHLQMMIIQANRWEDVPLEKLIEAMWDGFVRNDGYEPNYPKMKVSGITAHTREKQRSYDCSGFATITYKAKYANE